METAMTYEILIWNATDSTWLRLDADFESFEKARSHLDGVLRTPALAAALGLPAPVKIRPRIDALPEAPPVFSHVWRELEDRICADNDKLNVYLELAVCEGWTDEDAEIAAELGLGLDAFDQDWRDSQIMASGDPALAYETIGDPIDNALVMMWQR